MKIHFRILTAVTLFLMLSIHLSAQSSDAVTYNADGVTLTCPAGWQMDDKGTLGTKVIFFSAPESRNDQFRENVNLLIQDLSERPMTLKEYTALSLRQINTMLSHSKLGKSKTIKTPNGEAQLLTYTSSSGIRQLKYQQLFLIIRKKAYVLTYTAEQNKFKKFLPQAKAIFDSFIVK